MFKAELPKFFTVESTDQYFVDDVNKLFGYKTHESFEGESLKEFMDVSNTLEDRLLEFNNIINQKLSHYSDLKKSFEKNNEQLRELNDQICVAKVEKKTFGHKTLAETYGEGEIKPDLVDLIKKEEE